MCPLPPTGSPLFRSNALTALPKNRRFWRGGVALCLAGGGGVVVLLVSLLADLPLFRAQEVVARRGPAGEVERDRQSSGHAPLELRLRGNESHAPSSRSGAKVPTEVRPTSEWIRQLKNQVQSHELSGRDEGALHLARRLSESLDEFDGALHERGPQADFLYTKIVKEWRQSPELGVSEIPLLLERYDAETFPSFRAELIRALDGVLAGDSSAARSVREKAVSIAEQELSTRPQIPEAADLSRESAIYGPHVALATQSFRLLVNNTESRTEAENLHTLYIRKQSNPQIREAMLATLLAKFPDVAQE